MPFLSKLLHRISYSRSKAIQIAPLFSENNILMLLRMFFDDALVRRRLFSVKISGLNLKIRSFSSDLLIANAWLRNELADQYDSVEGFDGVIIDAGGHIGMAAISFARRFPNKTVVTLEPSVENYQLLQSNTEQFENIIAMNCALGPEDGELQIIDSTGDTDGYIVQNKNQPRCAVSSAATVRVISVPALLKELGCKDIALLKVDIEGFEVELFSGNISWVEDVGLMAIELHERFRTGSTRSFINATQLGRTDLGFVGEMYFSALDPTAAVDNTT